MPMIRANVKYEISNIRFNGGVILSISTFKGAFHAIMISSLLISGLFAVILESEIEGFEAVLESAPVSFTSEPVMWGTTNVDIGDVGLRFYGEANSDFAGKSLDGVGDVNGDGIDDFVIGAYGNDEGGKTAGQVYLFFGRSAGFPKETNVSSANASFVGFASNDRAGISVAGVGDVNGDDYDDFVIGADEYVALGTTGRGRAFLILGKSSGWSMDMSLAGADASWYGEVNEDMFGRAVGGGGDINGDGYDDIIIGAYDNEEGGDIQGQTYLIFGRSSGWSTNQNIGTSANASFIGKQNKEQSGYSVDIVGDTNGDGYDDFVIGARYFADTPSSSRKGHAYLFLGRSGPWSMDSDITSSNATFVGQRSLAGSHVCKAGDVNGDDLADFMVTEHMNSEYKSEMGQTYLIFGNRSGWSNGTKLSDVNASFWGENAYDEAGRWASGGGDVNGDGYDDIIIGSYRNKDGGNSYPYYAGKIYVVYGREKGWRNDTSLSLSDASFIGEHMDGALGICVANAGDVNNDGMDDILAGAWMADLHGSNTGITYLINRTPSQGVTGLELEWNSSIPSVNLSWDNDRVEPFQYGIYKAVNGSSPERIGNTTESFFNDTQVTIDINYTYSVVRFCPLGRESEMASPLSIMLTKIPDENKTDDDDNVTDDDKNITQEDNITDDDDNVTDDDKNIPQDDDSSDDTNDDTPQQEEDDRDDPGGGLRLMIPMIGVLLLVVILIFIFFIISRRKNKEDEEE